MFSSKTSSSSSGGTSFGPCSPISKPSSFRNIRRARPGRAGSGKRRSAAASFQRAPARLRALARVNDPDATGGSARRSASEILRVDRARFEGAAARKTRSTAIQSITPRTTFRSRSFSSRSDSRRRSPTASANPCNRASCRQIQDALRIDEDLHAVEVEAPCRSGAAWDRT
jgi:hypothetical protein